MMCHLSLSHKNQGINALIRLLRRKIKSVLELKDDSNGDPSKAMGQATFSNSDSMVLVYVSTFENLWIQTEMRRKHASKNKLECSPCGQLT
jgi:hypothetical protein